MVTWEMLEKWKFFYDDRNSPEHPELVEIAERCIKRTPMEKRSRVIDDIFIVVGRRTANPRFPAALGRCMALYDDIRKNRELYDYARYLNETFGLKQSGG